MAAGQMMFQSVSGAKLDPGIEFLETVQALLHATEGDPTALDELGELLTNDVVSERVRAVVDQAREARLRQFGHRLDERFKGPQWLRLLLTPVGQLPYDALAWSFNHAPSSDSDDSEGVRFILGGARGAPIIARTPENDLQYRFDALLTAAGQLRVPFRFDTRAVERPRVHLDFRFEHPPQILLSDALANDLPRLDELIEPAELPDSNLKRVELEIEGQVLLGANRCRATSWSTRRTQDDRAFDAPRCVAADVRYQLEWAHPGRFKLEMRPDALHGTMIAALVAVNDENAARVIELGRNLGSRGLERIVRPLLERHSQAPPDLIELADRYSRPREILEEHLEQTLVTRPALTQELRSVLLAGSSRRNTSQAFIEQVCADAGALVDEHDTLWHPLLSGDPRPAVAHLLTRLDLAPELRRFARGVLQRWLEPASRGLRDALLEELEELLEDDEEARALRALGGALDDTVDAALARRLLGVCVEFIAGVRRASGTLLRAVEASIGDAVGLELARIEQEGRHERILVELSFDPRNEDARRLYREMLTGDFREALEQAVDGAHPHIVLERGALGELLTRERSTEVYFELTAAEPEALDLLRDELEIEPMAGGAIRIRPGATEPIEASVLSLSPALALATANRGAMLAIRHRRLAHHGVQQHLATLEHAGLIAAGSIAASARSVDFDTFADLKSEILCDLTPRELERAFARDPRDVERVTIEEQLRILDECMPESRARIMLLDDLHEGEAVAYVQALAGKSLHQIRDAIETKDGAPSRTVTRSLAELVHALATNSERMNDFLRALETLWTMDLGAPRRNAELRESHVIEIEALHEELTDLTEGFGGEADGYWRYAFLTSLRRLAGIDRTVHPLVAALRWTGNGRIQRHLFA